MLPSFLLSREDLGPEQSWRLVDSLFAQLRSLLEGSAVLVLLQAVCAWRTGNPVFAGLALAAGAVFAARIGLARRYWARRGQGTPRAWAMAFAAGGIATAAIWGATGFLALTVLPDPALRMTVVMVQAGWNAGVAVRNAASPAAMLLQTLASAAPPALACLFSADPALRFAALFYPVQLSANANIAAYLGAQMLSLLASERALAAANNRLSASCADLAGANRRLRHLSDTDPLTAIGNRRAFDAVLRAEWARAARDADPISLLMLDVDLFKLFNDRYGHPAGDDCLRLVAGLLARGVRRPPDFAGRFGGEEFVALLPGVDAAGAAAVAERLRADIMEAARPHAASPFGVITVSIGAATAHPRPGGDPASLVAAADAALYGAKAAGRNRIATARPPEAAAA